MGRSRLRISSFFRGRPLTEAGTILGHNGPGQDHASPSVLSPCAYFYIRIFRTDYGHTEVAAHFGNGKKMPMWFPICGPDELYRPERILYLNQGICA
jgi:hypothetical protein